MKKLFTAIKKGDIETVKALIQADNNLVNCIAKQPPKSDDGQSPLQIALKNGQTEIANYLIDMGANVNFMESEQCCNIWRTPVIFDAITCAIMCSRWNVIRENEIEVYNIKEKADSAFLILDRMIKTGANLNINDSLGRSVIFHACNQAEQILPRYDCFTKSLCNDRKITKELNEDLHRIFDLLISSGADTYYKNQSEKTIFEHFENRPVLNFIK